MRGVESAARAAEETKLPLLTHPVSFNFRGQISLSFEDVDTLLWSRTLVFDGHLVVRVECRQFVVGAVWS